MRPAAARRPELSTLIFFGALAACSSNKHAGDETRRDAVTAPSGDAIVVPGAPAQANASSLPVQAGAVASARGPADPCDRGARLAAIAVPRCAVLGCKTASHLPPPRAWVACTKGFDKVAGCRELAAPRCADDRPKIVAFDPHGAVMALGQTWNGGTLVEFVDLDGKTLNAIAVSGAIAECQLENVSVADGQYQAWVRLPGSDFAMVAGSDGGPGEPLQAEAAYAGKVRIEGETIKSGHGGPDGRFPEKVSDPEVFGEVAVARSADGKHIYSGRPGETALAIADAPAGATISALGVSASLLAWLEQRGDTCTLMTSLRAEKPEKIAARKLGVIPCAPTLTVGPAHAIVGGLVVRLSDGRRLSPWKDGGLSSGAFVTATELFFRLDSLDVIQRVPLASFEPGEPMPE